MKITDCPKFKGCDAPICPLDPDWRKRRHLEGESICLYLREYSKPAIRPILDHVVPMELLSVIAEAYTSVLSTYGPIRRALKRISKTPSKILSGSRLGHLREIDALKKVERLVDKYPELGAKQDLALMSFEELLGLLERLKRYEKEMGDAG